MKKSIRNISFAATFLAALSISSPVFAEEKDKHDHKDHAENGDHKDHGDHEGHKDHAEHGKKAAGTGKATIGEISQALQENLACLDKELAAANHDVFHGCLETIEALGVDLVALKEPTDPTKKKRVDGYAKNLGMMAHKIDELMDGKQPDKAKAQLGKLKTQVDLILKQFPAQGKADKPASKKEAAAKDAPGHEGHGH